MSVITGIQRRPPNQLSSGNYSVYDNFVESAEFSVRRKPGAGGAIEVEVYFPRSGTPEQGVGLLFPSLETAVAVGRALLSVGEGYVRETTARF
jgi:hypothetical protein